MSARTGSLPVSSSFRVTYFRTLHCLPLSVWVASQVNSRYVITLHFLKRAWLTTSTLFVAACLHWYQNIAFKLHLSAASRTATYCILHDWEYILPGCFGSLYKLISACCCCCENAFPQQHQQHCAIVWLTSTKYLSCLTVTHIQVITRAHTHCIWLAVGTFNQTQAIEYCLTVNNVLLLDSPFGKNDIR